MYIFLPGNYSLMSSFKCLLYKIQNKSWKGISNEDCIEQVGLWACAYLWDLLDHLNWHEKTQSILGINFSWVWVLECKKTRWALVPYAFIFFALWPWVPVFTSFQWLTLMRNFESSKSSIPKVVFLVRLFHQATGIKLEHISKGFLKCVCFLSCQYSFY